jgi:hypothetical protein
MRYQFATGPEFSKIHEDREMTFVGLSDLPLMIGLTGPFKSGKTTVAQYLVAERGFDYVGLSSFVRERAGQVGSDDWDRMQQEGLRWRQESGDNAVLIEEFLRRSSLSSERIVIDSLMYTEEVHRLRQLPNFYLLSVLAKLALRWETLCEWYGGEDQVPMTYDDFVAQDEWQCGRVTWPDWEEQSPNVDGCVGLAYDKIENKGSELQMQLRADEIIKDIISKRGLLYSCQWCEW